VIEIAGYSQCCTSAHALLRGSSLGIRCTGW
jgi:hypothetical protein